MAWVLNGVVNLVALVCFILVVVKMFQTGQTGLGVLTIITIFCGIGGLIALIWGWSKAQQLNFVPVMVVYTACILIGIVLYFTFPIPLPFGK